VVSLSVSLVAVFIPLLFADWIVGRLFREFAITMSVAVGVSAFVSLTHSMMCANLLRAERRRREHKQILSANRGILDALSKLCEYGLRWVLAHQRFV
jgi:multidrug efflux pump subunit AcrB